MEKKRLTGKDILRMDGLLPPTRRLPVCNAVTSTSDKKKDKKWSFGGFLKRISSIRDCDSSSNEEEMVYCKREPKKRINVIRKSNGVVLRPVRNSVNQRSDQNNLLSTGENNVGQSTDSLDVRRESVHSRSSDGSLDGLGRKIRKSKVKARVEAKRDRLCAESSSDEDSRVSNNSLTRSINEECTQNGQKNNSCSRKTRAARTERYIKRLSRDEGNGGGDYVCDINGKSDVSEYFDHYVGADTSGLYRPPIHPRRTQRNFPSQKSSIECAADFELGIPIAESRTISNVPKYPTACRYVTDLNQNNSYKMFGDSNSDQCIYGKLQQAELKTKKPVTNINSQEFYTTPIGFRSEGRTMTPPTPPPRNPHLRPFTYSYNSFPLNGKYQRNARLHDRTDTRLDEINGPTMCQKNNLRSYGSNNEITWCGTVVQEPRRPMSLNSDWTQLCDSQGYVNKKYKPIDSHTRDFTIDPWRMQNPVKETETTKYRRNDIYTDHRSNDITYRDTNTTQNAISIDLGKVNISGMSNNTSHGSLERFHRIPSSSDRTSPEAPSETTSGVSNKYSSIRKQSEDEMNKELQEEALERKRNSKNLEEALSELEAIYNSLRLGDEDLLDRAERRSMEEFSLKQSRNESDVVVDAPDSPDRTKDDMAYRRMNPKERPTSLSDTIGQSSLSKISYLIASPVLSRKDLVDDYASAQNYPSRRDEPDVMRDDVVFRSINHANNTLKVLDPQPPFGIPLGPVTTATESDYLHTTPRKLDHPRSPYIPQSEPDVVTDDLAFRTLRKDSNIPKNVSEDKCDDKRWELCSTICTKKKRAVRSLSANLYGLINQDRIHLHKQSSLRKINDDMDGLIIGDGAFPRRSESFRRVVSDGELSDHDSRWRVERSSKNNIDINGNHPISAPCQKKLRVYISPVATTQTFGQDDENDANGVRSTFSGSISSKTLEDEFCHAQSDSNLSASSKKSVESDFSAYTRLCQDLVDLIRVPDNAEIASQGKENREEKSIDEELESKKTENSPVAFVPNTVSNTITRTNERTVPCTQSLDNHYAQSKTVECHSESPKDEGIGCLDDPVLNLKVESDVVRTEELDSLDYYLRLADENVKLIAEAFSSVADHIRDSDFTRKRNTTARHSREAERDGGTEESSARSSVLCEERETDRERSTSSRAEESDVVSEKRALVLGEWDQPKEAEEPGTDASPDSSISLELFRAVRDLRTASTSFSENVKKDEKDLETRFSKFINDHCDEVVTTVEEAPLIDKDAHARESDEVERERDQEETVISARLEARDECNEVNEGEVRKCELDRKMLYGVELVRSARMRFPHVTNIITVTITTYSVVLLAYLLALLLAIVAAS